MGESIISRAARCAALVAVFSVVPTNALAADVVEIIEHWQLTVGGPETARSAPQVTMVMSPTGHTDTDFFIVSLNHWTSPDFEPGGIQIQHWYGDQGLCEDTATTVSPLESDGETVSWKQRMAVEEGQIVFEVIDGSSETWGAFAPQGDLRLQFGSPVERLNGYLPAVSINESGIGYAGNRVSSLVLQKIQWRFAGETEFEEMVAPIDIDADLDP